MKIMYKDQEISMESSFSVLDNKPSINGNELIGANNRSQDIQLVWHGTQNEFDSLTEYNNNCIYIIQKEKQTPILIDETAENFNDYQLKIDPNINTASHNVIDAINEVKDHIGSINELQTNNTNSIVDASNSIIESIGDTSLFTTTEKNVMVAVSNEITTSHGKKSELTTAHKDTAVNAVNDLVDKLGDKNSLTTINKITFVNGINEVQGNIGNETTLTTTAKDTLVNAINEIKIDVGDRTKLTTVSKDSLVSAINENEKEMGNLSSLNTTDKANLVGAINSIVDANGGMTSSGKSLPISITFTNGAKKNTAQKFNEYACYIAKDIVYFKIALTFTTGQTINDYIIPFATAIKIDGRSLKKNQSPMLVQLPLSGDSGSNRNGTVAYWNNKFNLMLHRVTQTVKVTDFVLHGIVRLA